MQLNSFIFPAPDVSYYAQDLENVLFIPRKNFDKYGNDIVIQPVKTSFIDSINLCSESSDPYNFKSKHELNSDQIKFLYDDLLSSA